MKRMIVLSTVFVLSVGSVASADLVYEPIITDKAAIQAASPIGQSFAAVDPMIASIGVSIYDCDPSLGPADHSLALTLYDGSGMGGVVLATVNTAFTAANYPDTYAVQWLDFDFNTPVSLNVGQAYTFVVSDATPRWAIGVDTTSGYSGGEALLGGSFQPADLAFRVKAAGPVPSPTSAVLALIGLPLIALVRRLRG